jgi:ribulose-phosphate 3-epimerase
VHPETTRHLDRTLSLIQSCGCKAGIALNPASSLEFLHYELDRIDMVLLMSVNPGFGGQSFIPTTLGKIAETRSILDLYREQSGRSILLEVDGGIKAENIAEVAGAGADTFVAGSAIFSKKTAEGYREVISRMRSNLSAL